MPVHNQTHFSSKTYHIQKKKMKIEKNRPTLSLSSIPSPELQELSKICDRSPVALSLSPPPPLHAKNQYEEITNIAAATVTLISHQDGSRKSSAVSIIAMLRRLSGREVRIQKLQL